MINMRFTINRMRINVIYTSGIIIPLIFSRHPEPFDTLMSLRGVPLGGTTKQSRFYMRILQLKIFFDLIRLNNQANPGIKDGVLAISAVEAARTSVIKNGKEIFLNEIR